MYIGMEIGIVEQVLPCLRFFLNFDVLFPFVLVWQLTSRNYWKVIVLQCDEDHSPSATILGTERTEIRVEYLYWTWC